MVLGKLDNYMWKNQTEQFPYTICKKKKKPLDELKI